VRGLAGHRVPDVERGSDDGLVPQRRRAELALAWTRCNRFLTSIRVQIESAWRLARQRDMVSQPSENILSTATAEPGDMLEKANCMRLTMHQEYTKCHEPCKTVRELSSLANPPVNWITRIEIFAGSLEGDGSASSI